MPLCAEYDWIGEEGKFMYVKWLHIEGEDSTNIENPRISFFASWITLPAAIAAARVEAVLCKKRKETFEIRLFDLKRSSDPLDEAKCVWKCEFAEGVSGGIKEQFLIHDDLAFFT